MTTNTERIVPASSPTLRRMEAQENANTPAAVASASTGGGGKQTSIHVTALDGIVSVNSLFTMALFIGFSLTLPDKATAVSNAACTTSPETVRRLIVFEVISFSFFLFSSLIAQSLKLLINLKSNAGPTDDPTTASVNPDHHKFCLFASAAGSALGCTFLMMSIVDFIRVKLGSLSCGGKPRYAVATLVVFVGAGLLVYVITAGYAVFYVQGGNPKNEENNAQQNQS